MEMRRALKLVSILRAGWSDIVELCEVTGDVVDLHDDEFDSEAAKLSAIMEMSHDLLVEGYMKAGDTVSTGEGTWEVEAWELPVEDVLERIEQGLLEVQLDAVPGDVVRFQTTPKGGKLLEKYGFIEVGTNSSTP